MEQKQNNEMSIESQNIEILDIDEKHRMIVSQNCDVTSYKTYTGGNPKRKHLPTKEKRNVSLEIALIHPNKE